MKKFFEALGFSTAVILMVIAITLVGHAIYALVTSIPPWPTFFAVIVAVIGASIILYVLNRKHK